MPLVLIVEDDPIIREALSDALAGAGHVVRAVDSALAGLRQLRQEPPDLVILDLGLPDLDGADALRMLRAITNVPVIVATARRGEVEAIRLLNAGADDYLTKPFSAAHVLARVSAVLRRTGARTEPEFAVVEIGPLRLDEGARAASLDGVPLTLTRKEYDVLAYLAARPGRVVTRKELFTEVWQQPFVGADQTLDVHLSWLRRKLGETAAQPRLLRTVRGVGVMLVPPGPSVA
ncbi:DNA-binding response regulator [Rhizocola hellebori]|uniref:DNA-binding response regulator n=1 Tax=Rhizocola hellebori TaxID=1392758 RepID=A0A8J3Q9A6_9ACTN|nr:response regulator transcription factor [Rhizocola hellebori]GIH06301.1 DNA-binding response regulator [Rhizocola hellebori]